MAKIPKKLQPALWSIDVSKLDPRKDKVYIIHQIFSYGRLEDIIWLYKTYPKNELYNVFLKHPYKDYKKPRYNFVKNYLLDINDSLDMRRYVKNTPRILR